MNEKKYMRLNEVLIEDKVVFGRKNMIISPTGSGKTHLIKNVLAPLITGKKLLLVSTSSLKESFKGEENINSSQEMRRFDLKITDENIHVMTYAEFGNRNRYDDRFVSTFSAIFCDEIHSLFDYFLIHKSHKLSAAITWLFSKLHENAKVYYFTATMEKVANFIDVENYSVLLDDVKVVDYSNDERIYKNSEWRTIQYTKDDLELALGEEKDLNKFFKKGRISDNDEIFSENNLKSIGSMVAKGKKGIVYSERIKNMKKIEDVLIKKGFNVISLWSENNCKFPMNQEQLRVYSHILSTGEIPNEYDFIIINGALREGWNLIDKRVDVVILHTLNITDKIQARGRVRRDISIMLELVEVEEEKTMIETVIFDKMEELNIIENYLGKDMLKEDVDFVCKKINVRRPENNRLVKWTTIKRALMQNGYNVSSKRILINEKHITVSVITKVDKVNYDNSKNESLKPLNQMTEHEFLEIEHNKKAKKLKALQKDPEKAARQFISKLKKNGFEEKHDGWLTAYLNGKGKPAAFRSIKDAYIRNVVYAGRNESVFLNVLNRTAEDSKLFNDYNLFGIKTKTKQVNNPNPSQNVSEKEQELLDYIANNGGL